MLKKDVVVGKVYIARISGNLVQVRIDFETTKERYIGSAGSGKRAKSSQWGATNLKTGKKIVIKSAAKLRREAIVQRVASTESKPVSMGQVMANMLGESITENGTKVYNPQSE